MGRRDYQRYSVMPTTAGVVRVLRDVVVQRTGDRELVVISSEPGVIQSSMSLELHDQPGSSRVLNVRVVDSQPLLLDGSLRYRMVLEVLAAPPQMDGTVPAWELGRV
jgi:hypothetical protein